MLVSLWQAGGALLEEAVGGSSASKVLLPCAFLLTIAYLSKLAFKHLQAVDSDNVNSPPFISSAVPFLGHAVSFGKSPIEFLEKAYEKYGPVFSFTMVGKTFTYLVGSDAAALLFNSKNEDLNAEDVYSRLTTPVFGKGVAYDVPNPNFSPTDARCQENFSPTDARCQENFSPTDARCQENFSPTDARCQENFSPTDARCQENFSPTDARCQENFSPTDARCQENFSPTDARCQENFSPTDARCQENFSPTDARWQENFSPTDARCQENFSPTDARCQENFSPHRCEMPGELLPHRCEMPAIFLEQKKMFKTGLNIAHFKTHVRMIEEETVDYFKRWGDSGVGNLFEALSELIILTASRCLHGKEIRSMLDEKVAQLYADLDGGFTHAAWLLPGWLPLPSFRRRDRAHREIKNIFYQVIQKRRQSQDREDDMLQTLIDATYKDGTPLNNDEIAGMLIGLLLAGQHTSSTTSAWLGFFLAEHKSIQEQCFAEQKTVCGEDFPPLNYDQLKDLQVLDRCIKETLRLRPPIMTMMRMARTPQTIAGYNIPPGHQVCVSPTVNHRLKDTWVQNTDFNPDRYLHENPAAGEKFAYVPFGAGRHRCIGENFAYAQIKTIWSTMLRLYEFDLVDGYFPTINYTTMIHTPNNPIIRYKRRKV
ncbi:lanosterol 14-alpha demethylase isoform X2 [Rhinoderma darwinii]|uniref:lanosterol 14-alpha demethylase isoform X2 n=1 Tax=Rhinoderma darwinii TaxID=43563 RepID=UPI003F679FC3